MRYETLRNGLRGARPFLLAYLTVESLPLRRRVLEQPLHYLSADAVWASEEHRQAHPDRWAFEEYQDSILPEISERRYTSG